LQIVWKIPAGHYLPTAASEFIL